LIPFIIWRDASIRPSMGFGILQAEVAFCNANCGRSINLSLIRQRASCHRRDRDHFPI
jgi:hypothetical protein